MSDDIEALERVIQKTDEFINEVFDHSCSYFLGRLYDFKESTKVKLERAKADAALRATEEAKAEEEEALRHPVQGQY